MNDNYIIEFYFDCSSPWTYLAFTGLLDLQQKYNFQIQWNPILVGGIFNTINKQVYEFRENPIPEKEHYYAADIQLWAQKRKITINWPDIFPINSVQVMRGCFFALSLDQLENYVEKVFVKYWKEGADIANKKALGTICKELHWDEDEFFNFIGQQSTKDMLFDSTQELITRGGFGSPTFFMQDKIFFGNDRLHLLEYYLEQI
jgi:2-hydroxychromene-2-carboxylate isomerase